MKTIGQIETVEQASEILSALYAIRLQCVQRSESLLASYYDDRTRAVEERQAYLQQKPIWDAMT